MSEKNIDSAKIEAKKAVVIGHRKSRGKILAFIALMAAAGIMGVFYLKMNKAEDVSLSKGALFGNAPSEEALKYPLSDFESGKLRFFTYKSDPVTTVRYFIALSQSNLPIAGLDACAECWRFGDGHKQEGDSIICKTCGKSFPLDELGSAIDPCVPLSLAASVSQDAVHVPVLQLQEMAKYFKNYNWSK